MRRRCLMVATAGLLLAGCGGDAGPSELTAGFVTGVWDMATSGCHTDNLPVRLSASSDGALTSAVNAWGSQFSRPLDGAVDLGTGAAEFHMFADASREAAILFVGTLGADGSLTGTATDPMPGYSPIFHFTGGPICTAQVTGQRR